MSGWIVVTNCRDGHRLALPAAATVITYDRGVIDGVREHLQEVSQVTAEFPDSEHLPEELHGLVDQMRTSFKDQQEQARITAKTLQVAEAMVTTSCGRSYPVRDICYTEDFNDLARLTGGEPPPTKPKRPGR